MCPFKLKNGCEDAVWIGRQIHSVWMHHIGTNQLLPKSSWSRKSNSGKMKRKFRLWAKVWEETDKELDLGQVHSTLCPIPKKKKWFTWPNVHSSDSTKEWEREDGPEERDQRMLKQEDKCWDPNCKSLFFMKLTQMFFKLALVVRFPKSKDLK